MPIWLMDFLENYICLFVGVSLLGVRIALPIILLVRWPGVVVYWRHHARTHIHHQSRQIAINLLTSMVPPYGFHKTKIIFNLR
jgi:hypothetical protein